MGNPTKKARINLAVDDEIYATISEMAEMQGTQRATLVMDLLRSVHPALQRTLSVMKAAQQYQGEIPQELEQVISQALTGVVDSSRDQMHMLDELNESMRARSGEAGGADAPAPERSP